MLKQSQRLPRIHLWLPGADPTRGGIEAFSRHFLEGFVTATPGVKKSAFIKNDLRFNASSREESSSIVAHLFGHWQNGITRTSIFAASLALAALFERPSLIVVGHANFSRLAAWMHMITGVPFWVVTHGIEVWDYKRALAKSLQAADRVFSVSRYTRDQLFELHGLSPVQVSLLSNCVDENRFKPQPRNTSLLREWGIPETRRIVLTVCRLATSEHYKGYDIVLDVFPTLLKSVPDAHYVLCGTGDDVPRLRKQVKQLGLEAHVTLTGFVPEEELVDYYNLCAVFAMPSRKEGFGIVFLEALACGKPVLAAASGGAVDALCDGELGVLVDPTDSAELVKSLSAILNGTHPHPLIYSPLELRRRVIDTYGSKRFEKVLTNYVAEFLTPILQSRVPGK